MFTITVRPGVELARETVMDLIMGHARERRMSYTANWGSRDPVTTGTVAKGVPFKAPLLEGGVYDFGQVVGKKAAVLTFWASWCEPCIREASHLQRLWKELGPRGVQFVSVSIDTPEDVEKLRAVVERLQLTFPVVLDPKGETLERYAAGAGIPLTFVLSRTGEVTYRRGNYRPGDEVPLDKAIRATLR